MFSVNSKLMGRQAGSFKASPVIQRETVSTAGLINNERLSCDDIPGLNKTLLLPEGEFTREVTPTLTDRQLVR